jgi:hypothetical protein
MRFEPEDTRPVGTRFADEPRSTAEPLATAAETGIRTDETTEKQSIGDAQPASRNVQLAERNEEAVLESKRETTNASEVVREVRSVAKALVDSDTPSSVIVDPMQPALTKREQKSVRPYRHEEKRPLVTAAIPETSQQSHRMIVNGQSTGEPERQREAFVKASEAGRLRTTHRSPAATPAPDEAPVIHVSIGKVEIRAVTPPPQRPAAPRSSAMSIEEYSAKHLGRR